MRSWNICQAPPPSPRFRGTPNQGLKVDLAGSPVPEDPKVFATSAKRQRTSRVWGHRQQAYQGLGARRSTIQSRPQDRCRWPESKCVWLHDSRPRSRFWCSPSPAKTANCPLMSVPWHEFRTTASSRCSTVMRRSVDKSPVASTWAMTASANRLRRVASSGCAANPARPVRGRARRARTTRALAKEGQGRPPPRRRRRYLDDLPAPAEVRRATWAPGPRPWWESRGVHSALGPHRRCTTSSAITKRAMRPSSSSPLSLRVNTKAISRSIVRRSPHPERDRRARLESWTGGC